MFSDLPKVVNTSELLGLLREDALKVVVMRDGAVIFDAQFVLPEELSVRLQDRVRSGAPKKVYIRADERARYIRVKEVLDSIGSAGLSDIAFVTERRRGNL